MQVDIKIILLGLNRVGTNRVNNIKIIWQGTEMVITARS